MGNDGGSIPDRRDLVRSKPKAEQADKANQSRARWFFCALSKRPLQEPVVSCALGKLYNKDALLEYLLDRSSYGDGDEICGHIRSLKDVVTLKLTPNPVVEKDVAPTDDVTTASNGAVRARYVCPLTLKEMTGAIPFVYPVPCGCLLSLAGLNALRAKSEDRELCPQCLTKYAPATDIRTINPPQEEEDRLRMAMEVARAAEPKKEKKKKRKAAGDTEPELETVKKPRTQPAPTTNTSTRAVVAGLAMEEAKRKAGMSDAVKSLYSSKDGPQRKETFMTMGTFTRYA